MVFAVTVMSRRPKLNPEGVRIGWLDVGRYYQQATTSPHYALKLAVMAGATHPIVMSSFLVDSQPLND